MVRSIGLDVSNEQVQDLTRAFCTEPEGDISVLQGKFLRYYPGRGWYQGSGWRLEWDDSVSLSIITTDIGVIQANFENILSIARARSFVRVLREVGVTDELRDADKLIRIEMLEGDALVDKARSLFGSPSMEFSREGGSKKYVWMLASLAQLDTLLDG